MSNKRQLKRLKPSTMKTMMTMKPPTVTFKTSCDLKSALARTWLSILLLLVTSTTLIVQSAKLEAVSNKPETVTKSTTIKIATNDNDDDGITTITSDNRSKAAEALLLRQQHKHDTLDEAAENFYHSELQRLSYDTIHSILRDENEPIYRREDNDRRYYHAKSLQPTHEIMKREADDLPKSTATTITTKVTPSNPTSSSTPTTPSTPTPNNLSYKSLITFNITGTDEKLRTLNLSHNQLSALPLSENSTLVLLDLNSNRIQTAMAPLNNHLRTLYLSSNRIENLAALNLSQLTALETLDLSCNRIRNLETSFFPQLMHNLKFLNLAHNHLGSISRETFYNLLSLNTLLLAHNNITNIDYETFLSLPNLQYLDLSHNQLRGESIRALQGIPDLVGLSIAYNADMGESLQEFVASWSLKEVDASGTGLCQIPAALATAVRTLKLADNWLKIINCGDLDSYPLLTHLDLSNSHIEDIEDDAMGRLEFLVLLFLDHNHLRKVPVSLPTSLEHLFLQYNEIMDLQVQAFVGLRNLKTLDLSHNKLLYLPALPLPKLLTLNLQASGLQGLNQAIVHTLPHLRDLLLEENPIKCSDLLGIAEWASPCRIAERTNTATTKPLASDGEQIASDSAGGGDGNGIDGVDVGQKQLQLQQQQLQTVAKTDLKAKFVQTHNFYEKFSGSACSCVGGGVGVGSGGGSVAVKSLKPPLCALELENNFALKVEKPTVLTVAATAKQQFAAQPNVNFNEQHKLAQAKKSTTAASAVVATKAPLGIPKNASHAATKMPATKTFPTKNVVIANVTSAVEDIKVAAVRPTTFLAINSIKSTKISQTTAEPTVTLMPTTTIEAAKTTPTAAATLVPPTLMTIKTLNKSSEIAATKSPNLSLLLPATMTTKMPTNILATSSTTVTSLRSSLLERQRRLDSTTLQTLQATATTVSNLAVSDSQKMLLLLQQRKSSNNLEHSNGSFKNKTFGESLVNVVPTAAAALYSSTTIRPQTTTHKHVTLQLNSKDRHLIGTPLLTHHGQNLMVAAEELKKNGNHIASKTAANTTMLAPLDKSQNHQTEKEVNKFSKVHDAENNAKTTTPTTAAATTSHLAASETATIKPIKASKKQQQQQLNEQKKKATTTLIMKKMTITTTATKQQQATTNTTTKQATQQQQQQPQQRHHHYTLNTARENEASPGGDNSGGGKILLATTAAEEQPLAAAHHLQSSNVKHHSTVNTPVHSYSSNGHEEYTPQTFQEHNEIEEAAAAVAARASISAKFNSKLHAHDDDTEWSTAGSRHQRKSLHFDNPIVVFIVGIALFVTLVMSLLHAYRCKMPALLNMQRQQTRQRPHQEPQQTQAQQMRIRNSKRNNDNGNFDEADQRQSFLDGGSNQFQRQWRLEQAIRSQQQLNQLHSHEQQQQQYHHQSSPFHNLQVRELQQTSAVEPCPRFCKSSNYNINSALGERSNSQTSSSCSPHSSCTFDDETCYIEMTTDVGQSIAGAASSTAALCQGDLLPMELLSVAQREFNEIYPNQQQQQQQQQIFNSTTCNNSTAFQTSTIDDESSPSPLEHVLAANPNVSNTKLTPRTRKLGLW